MTEKFYKGDWTNCRYDICEIKYDNDIFCTVATEDVDLIIDILNNIEELKKENKALIHLLENQLTIIQKLYCKLLEYQLKEPITLTKEDLKTMDKAISCYTHRRCGE